MKKFITWLFADFFYGLNEIIIHKFCKCISTTNVFALFKNGVEIPNTRYEATDPIVGLVAANPVPTYGINSQLAGESTISLSANDEIELRVIQGVANPTVLASSNGQSVVASLNIEKVS